MIEIELLIIRIDSGLIIDVAAIGGRILGKQRGGRAADKVGGSRQDRAPQACVERRVVNAANKVSKIFISAHANKPIRRCQEIVFAEAHAATANIPAADVVIPSMTLETAQWRVKFL